MTDFRTTTDYRKTHLGTNPGCRYHVNFAYTTGELAGYHTDSLEEALSDYNASLDQPDFRSASIGDSTIRGEDGNPLKIYVHSAWYKVTPAMRKQLALAQATYPEWGPARAEA